MPHNNPFDDLYLGDWYDPSVLLLEAVKENDAKRVTELVDVYDFSRDQIDKAWEISVTQGLDGYGKLLYGEFWNDWRIFLK